MGAQGKRLVVRAQLRAVDWVSCEKPTGQQHDGGRRLGGVETESRCARRLAGADVLGSTGGGGQVRDNLKMRSVVA